MDSKPICQHFADDLTALVARYCDQGLTVAEALGCLVMVQHDVIMMAASAGDSDGSDEVGQP